jgi:hypothetical protein
MSTHTTFFVFLRRVVGCLCAASMLWWIGAYPQAASAAPQTYFASQGGSGTTCSQGQPCTLQAAMGKAVDGDTVYVAGGIYAGTGETVIAITHSISLLGGWDGAASGPVVRDSAAYVTTLDGQDQRRVVSMTGHITPRLEGFTITRGDATSSADAPGMGGGIYGSEAAPTITNNIIENNQANSEDTWGYGGGVYLSDTFAAALISGNIVSGNTANSSMVQGGEGGGLIIRFATSQVTITGNTFQNNVAGQTSNSSGGAISIQNSSAEIRNNLLQENQAGINDNGFGGGLYHQAGTVVLDGNTVISNGAEFGALTFMQDQITLTNNVIALNTGGGVLARGTISTPLVGTLVHNTIVQNGSQGVFAGWYASGYATLTLTNNIITGHTTGIEAYPHASNSNVVNASYTLFYANTADTSGSTINNTHALTGQDPRLVSSGGRYDRLRCNSPAIDAGTPSAGLATDIDGDPRNDGAPDIGADEFAGGCVYLPLVLKQ